MSGTELDPDGTDSYHPDHPWEQTTHPMYVTPSARTMGNWPPVDAEPAGPHEAAVWAALPSIADMVPGAHAYVDGRFGDDGVCHAHTPGHTAYSAWPDRCYRPRADRVHIDPSTIRDVTPPKE